MREQSVCWRNVLWFIFAWHQMSSSPSRYQKQILFSGIGEAGQQRLRSSRAVLVGCGALGSVIAETLVRAGIGALTLIDRDFVELSNLQRQVLYDEEDVTQRLPKAIAAERKLKRINSEVELTPHVCDVTCRNIPELVSGADVILDGTDNFETRFLVNDISVETGIPWVHGGCVGSHGQVMAIVPGQTPCLRCVMPEIPGPGTTATCDSAGVIGPAVQVVASLQSAAALKLLTGQRELIRPEMIVVDVWNGTFRQVHLGSLVQDCQCPCCAGGERLWLSGQTGSHATVLCGRNSVQISPSGRLTLSLQQLRVRLADLGETRVNPFLLTFRPGDSDYELTIFSDGRAIVTGTEDLVQARALYTQYVGL